MSKLIKVKKTITGKYSLKINKMVVFQLDNAFELTMPMVSEQNQNTLSSIPQAYENLYHTVITELYISLKPKFWKITEELKFTLDRSEALALFIALVPFDEYPLLLQLKSVLHEKLAA